MGGSKAVSGVMLAMLIRSLFWHKESASYRVDGRTKASWIVEVFGLSRRAVTDARATHIVLACIRVAKRHRISNPFKLAHEDGWTRERWNAALASYEAKQFEQMQRSRCEENTDE